MTGRNKWPPKKRPKPRNPVALKLLTDGTFRPRKVANPKTYKRKTKHKTYYGNNGDNPREG